MYNANAWRSGPGCYSARSARFSLPDLMLLAMNDRSFVVTTAYLKTEGDPDRDLPVLCFSASPHGAEGGRDPDRDHRRDHHRAAAGRREKFRRPEADAYWSGRRGGVRAFGVGFRGGDHQGCRRLIRDAASYTLMLGLFVQTLVLTIYLLRARPTC